MLHEKIFYMLSLVAEQGRYRLEDSKLIEERSCPRRDGPDSGEGRQWLQLTA
jgi:hypothetical protein